MQLALLDGERAANPLQTLLTFANCNDHVTDRC